MNSSDIKRMYLRPAFLACIIVLALGAGGKSVLINALGGYLEKEPLPLKQSLNSLDEHDLSPYKVAIKYKLENDDVIDSLGARDYLQWLFEDEEENPNSPVRKCVLFITYYDLPNVIPHTPEICYVGGGSELKESETVNIEVQNKDFIRKIPIKYLVFKGTDGDSLSGNLEFSILYCFYANGGYGCSRADTRYQMNKYFFKKHSFFSKIEMRFYNSTPSGLLIPSDREQSIAASQKLLSVLLPILEKYYWPDFGRQQN